MDLTIPLENTILNIRVAVILQTGKGLVLGRGTDKSYHHFVGGRVKAGETSLQAAKRELQEETGLEIDKFEFISVIENFWKEKDHDVQEICFVYKTDKVEKIFPKVDLQEFTKEEMKDIDIRPIVLKQLIMNGDIEKISHHIVK